MVDEYIRKESVIDVARKYFDMIGLNPEILVDSFITMPPADVVQVVHSRWKRKCGEIQCLKCGNRIRRIDLSGYLNFCPNCGAIMDAKEKG